MAVIQENFARCKCGHGYFEEKSISVIAKASPLDNPIILKTETTYYCQKCMTAHYTKITGGTSNV